MEMSQQPFRFDPRLPVGAVKTYGIKAPKSTHTRPATCAEAQCGPHTHGWKTVIDEQTELGKEQAYYIRNGSGRRYTEDRDSMAGVTVFLFEAGQTCFGAAEHRVSLDRPPLFIVRGGDWRGNPDGMRLQHANGDDWVDDFANHQDQLATRINQG
jgi:hypothetical protein